MDRLGELMWAKDDVLDNMGDSALKEELTYEYSAGAAVKRMIAVLKYSILTQPLQSFSDAEIMNMADILTAALVKGISTSELLKRMQVIECLIDEMSRWINLTVLRAGDSQDKDFLADRRTVQLGCTHL